MSKLDSKLEQQFNSEVKILGSLRHLNIVKLLCCISSADTKLLVYEYMENGSLDRWLHAPSPNLLDWPTRLHIAIGAAQGLCYMHHSCSPAIVHRDVKSSNILLDLAFRAQIADFGLARMLGLAGEWDTVSAVAGSIGYMAPECAYTRKLGQKVDVYSFGVVLLELTTGKPASGGVATTSLAEWAWQHVQEGNKLVDAIDERLPDRHAHLTEIAVVMKLGLICTGTLPSTRPMMKDVVQILLRCDRTASLAGELYENIGIIITGHSIGGAMASFCALDLVVNCGMPDVQLMTFGQPRIGNAVFASYFSKQIPRTIRLTNGKDMVPHLPPYFIYLPQKTYRHFPREVWLHDISLENLDVDGGALAILEAETLCEELLQGREVPRGMTRRHDLSCGRGRSRVTEEWTYERSLWQNGPVKGHQDGGATTYRPRMKSTQAGKELVLRDATSRRDAKQPCDAVCSGEMLRCCEIQQCREMRRLWAVKRQLWTVK